MAGSILDTNILQFTSDSGGTNLVSATATNSGLILSGISATNANMLGINNSTMSGSLLTNNIRSFNASTSASLWADNTNTIGIASLSNFVNIGSTTGIITLGTSAALGLTNSQFNGSVTVKGNLSRSNTTAIYSTAGPQTYTAQDLYDGYILRNCSGANRTDTTPSAAQIVAIIPGAIAGSSIDFTIKNTSNTTFETLSIVGGTGVTLEKTFIISSGNASSFIAITTNTGPGTEAVTIYNTNPLNSILVQGSFINNTAAAAGSSTYCQWGALTNTTAVVDSVTLGITGIIRRVFFTYSNSTSISITNASRNLDFSIGTANASLTTFTAFTGGGSILNWNRANVNATWPSSSSGPLSIPIGPADKLAIQCIETGAVTPTTFKIRITVLIDVY